MTDIALFAAFLLALIGGAWLFTRLRGVQAQYTETFALGADEKTLLEDLAADFHTVPALGQAAVMSFARMGRAHVLLTNRRVIIGQKVLFGKKHMITDVIHWAPKPHVRDEFDKMTGGLFTRGYTSRLSAPDKISVEMDGKKPYLRIILSDVASSSNVDHCRLYTEGAAEARARIASLAA